MSKLEESINHSVIALIYCMHKKDHDFHCDILYDCNLVCYIITKIQLKHTVENITQLFPRTLGKLVFNQVHSMPQNAIPLFTMFPVHPINSGAAADNSGTASDNSGTAADNSGTASDNSGTATDNSVAATDNNGAAADSGASHRQ